MNKRLLYCLVGIFTISNLNAQNLEYGLSFGVSRNGNSIYSKNNFSGTIYDETSVFNGLKEQNILTWIYERAGVNMGLHAKFKTSKKIVILSNLEYFRYHNACIPILMSDDAGYPIGTSSRRIVNNSLQLNSVGVFKLGKNTLLGGGGYINVLVSSKTILDKNMDFRDKNRFKNMYYQPLTFGLSILLGFEYEKTTLTFKLNHGLIDKIRGENKVKEFDTSLNIGLLYYFLR